MRERTGEIALPGANIEVRTLHANLDRVVLLGAIVAPRNVRQSVGISGLLGNLGIKRLKARPPCRVVDVASGVIGVGLQARELAVKYGAPPTHAVYGNAVTQQVLNGIFVGVGVEFRVDSVRNQQDQLAPFASPAGKKLGRPVNGVVDGFGAVLTNRQ